MGNGRMGLGAQRCWYLSTVQAVDLRGRMRWAAVVVTPEARYFVEYDGVGEHEARAALALQRAMLQVPWYRRPRRVRCATVALALAAGAAVKRAGVHVRADAKGEGRFAEAQQAFEAWVAADERVFRADSAA